MAIIFVPGEMHFQTDKHKKYSQIICLGFVINESEASAELNKSNENKGHFTHLVMFPYS